MKKIKMTVDSPVGPLCLVASSEALLGLYQGEQNPTIPDDAHEVEGSALLNKAREELDEYFAGTRTSFSLPLLLEGTEFQKQVWKALLSIPHGKTCSYMEIAIIIGKPKAVRAVGAANGKNPIGIIVPCHRVIGSKGNLTGYAGGIKNKAWLLAHEGARLMTEESSADSKQTRMPGF